jgi:phosphoribosylformylglycinamidine synthase
MSLLDNRDGLVLGVCNGFQALIKVGLVPYGKILPPAAEMPTLTYNAVGRHISRMAPTRVVSDLSPWSWGPGLEPGSTLHRDLARRGRVVMTADLAEKFSMRGRIFLQYRSISNGRPARRNRTTRTGLAYAIDGC